MKSYVLLARHGAIDHDFLQLDKDKLLKKEGSDVLESASKFAEHVAIFQESPKQNIVIGEVWHGTHSAVQQTWGIVQKALGLYGIKTGQIKSKTDLNPDEFWLLAHQDRKKITHCLINTFTSFPRPPANAKPANAILVIGHQPQLGWIADILLGKPAPIDRAEIMCISFSDSSSDTLWNKIRKFFFGAYRLEWVISPSKPEVTIQLREKIKSKIQLSGVLGGLIAALQAFLLSSLTDNDKWNNLGASSQLLSLYQFLFLLATLFLFASLVLYMMSLYAYDRLLMPVEFWGERVEAEEREWLVHRPPSADKWILYQNMLRIWNGFFIPASFCVAIALLLLGWSVFGKHLANDPILALLVVFLVLLVISLLKLWYRQFRPVIGSED